MDGCNKAGLKGFEADAASYLLKASDHLVNLLMLWPHANI